MFLLTFFDHKTLFACECLLSFVYCAVFIGLHSVYPQIRGVRVIAISFFLVIPHSVLLATRGYTPDIVSIVVANLFGLASIMAMYEAIWRFTGGRNLRWWLWGTVYVAVAVIFFFCEVQPNIVPRILSFAIAGGIIRAATAAALLRAASRSSQRRLLQIFGGLIILGAGESLCRAVMTWRFGAPADMMAADPIQTPAFVAGLVYLSMSGLFFLLLACNDLVLRTRKEAHQDPLSGTLNRRGLEEMLALELGRQGQRSLSVALIDIDHFKAVNDEQGHAAGDEALRLTAAHIAQRMRRSDHIGRLGGDEFLLILPRTGSGEALSMAARISADIAQIPVVDGSRALTISIGVTEAISGERPSELLSRADLALYRAKNDGRSCCRVLLASEIRAIDGVTAVA